MTFAADKRDASFVRAAERYEHALPYVATCFHMFVRHKLSADRLVNGVLLTARVYECLQWAEKGKFQTRYRLHPRDYAAYGNVSSGQRQETWR